MKAPTALGLSVLLALSMIGTASAVDLGALRDQQRSPVIQLDLGAADAAVITSDNVEYLGTIPLDSPGVGGELVEHADGETYFYATGAKGLTIYDVSDPALPFPVSVTPFPHAQNEDLKVSEDGTRAVISADGSIAVPVMPATTGIHVFDTSDVTEPVLLASSNPAVNGDGVGTGRGEHTAECADADCKWIYGSSSGQIYDATKADEGIITNTEVQWNLDLDGAAVSGRHALNRDASGLVVSDSQPRLVLDTTGDFGDGTGTPGKPEVLAVGNRSRNADNSLQHNNVRPDADAWQPRGDDDGITWVDVDRSEAAANTLIPRNETGNPAFEGKDFAVERPAMGPGELLIGNSETNVNNSCSKAGGLTTWSMIDFEKGAEMVQLEAFKPLSGNWADGSPARNGLGCSGHWFTERDGVVTASWYEHGVRFFDVDKTTGEIDQLGFFQPVVTQAGAAYWIDDEHVYSMDYARGLDILRLDRDGDVPSQERFDASWMANLDKVGALSAADRMWCRLGTVD